MKNAKRLAAILVAFAVTFTSLPMMAGDLAVHAASKPPQVTGVATKAVGTYSTIIKWKPLTKKQQKKAKW